MSKKRNKKYRVPYPINEYNLGSFLKTNAGGIAGAGSALTGIIGTGIANAQIADTSGIEGSIKGLSNKQFNASSNDELIQLENSINYLNNVKYNDIRGGSNGQRLMSTLGSTIQGVSSGAQIGGGWGALAGGVAGLGSAIGGIFTGNAKAKKKTTDLNSQIAEANNRAAMSLNNNISNVDATTDLNMLANYAAYGGGFTHGANWDNGLTFFDEGNSHEENPNGGVMVGVDQEGTPNMVEEGEVRWKDYIFSDRLKVKENKLKQFSLPTIYKGKTFAEISKKISQESDERPNDPISKAGLEDSLSKLMQLQEMERQKKLSRQQPQKSNMFLWGGDENENNSLLNNNQIIFQKDPNYKSQKSSQYPYMLDPKKSAFQNIAQRKSEQLGEKFGVSPEGLKFTKQVGTSQKGNEMAVSGDGNNFDLSYLRYAPVVGSALGVFSDAVGLTNKPDYTNADMILNTTKGLKDVSYDPIGNYMAYNPLDRNYYLNQLHGQAGASRRAITESAGGNRGTAMAGLLASDYNTTLGIGNMARQAEEYNLTQRQKVEEFNRGTNMFNSEAGLKAAAMNQSNQELKLRAIMSAAELRDRERQSANAGKSANLSNLFENIGNVGREEYAMNQRNWEIEKGIYGNMPLEDIMKMNITKDRKLDMARKQGWTDDELKARGYLAYGGKLNSKRKGYTF